MPSQAPWKTRIPVMHNRLLYLLLPGLFAFLPATTEKTFHNQLHPSFVLSRNQFAFHLLDAVVTEDNSSTNKLVSPLSLYLSLGMLCNGAAAPTSGSNKPSPNPRVVRFDHPFVFFLFEKKRNLILMAGVVNDPAQQTAQPKPALVKRSHRLRSIFRRH
jgi:hypothetical protein